MEVTVIPIVIGALETILKNWLKEPEDLEIRRRAETIQTTELLRLFRILRAVLETRGDLRSPWLQWSTINKRSCGGKLAVIIERKWKEG